MSQNHKLQTFFFLVRFLFTVVQTLYGSSVQFSPLGRWADMRDDIRDNMSVEPHINNVCRSAYSELRCISTIRHLLSADSTKKHLCPPLSHLGLIIVTRTSQTALNIFLKNYKRSKTQLQDVLKAHKTISCFTPSQNSSLAAHSSTYRI